MSRKKSIKPEHACAVLLEVVPNGALRKHDTFPQKDAFRTSGVSSRSFPLDRVRVCEARRGLVKLLLRKGTADRHRVLAVGDRFRTVLLQSGNVTLKVTRLEVLIGLLVVVCRMVHLNKAKSWSNKAAQIPLPATRPREPR